MHRLTVVTILGLIGTTATGFLGMNLLAEADAPLLIKIIYFTLTTSIFAGLTLISVAMSQRLTNLLDWFSGERDIW